MQTPQRWRIQNQQLSYTRICGVRQLLGHPLAELDDNVVLLPFGPLQLAYPRTIESRRGTSLDGKISRLPRGIQRLNWPDDFQRLSWFLGIQVEYSALATDWQTNSAQLGTGVDGQLQAWSATA